MKINDIIVPPKNQWTLKEERVHYERSLYEGLIVSSCDSDIFRFLKAQKIFAELNFGKEADSRFWVRISTPIRKEDLQKLIKGFEVRGWFMASSLIDYHGGIPFNDLQNSKYQSPLDDTSDSNELLQNINIVPPSFMLTMTFEAKYTKDAKDIISHLKYLYHATPASKVDKILKTGLSPRSGSKIAHHPDRVYLSTDPSHLENILIPKLAMSTDFEEDWVILSVDTTIFKNHSEKKIFKDPAADNAVFTFTNISPTYLAKVKDVKVEIK